jgi:uncharacterized repeat protein (TIGR03803 family)
MTIRRRAFPIVITFAFLTATALLICAQQPARPAIPTGSKPPQFLAVDVVPPGTAGTETVLHSFASPPTGANPYAGVIRDSAGNLYGTTYSGGAAGAGVVFKVDTAGNEIVLHSFTGGTDGANPYAGVIGDLGGNLYGTTFFGGAANLGVIYTLDPHGHETVLHSFGGPDGECPRSGVVRDPAGNVYGTAFYGGAANAGVVYKVDAAGNETVLHSFAGSDGEYPYAGVILDSAGNLYGTATQGGIAGAGVVYKVDTSGQQTVLYSFTGGADGGYPEAGLIRDSAGNFYGTTTGGGIGDRGVVFKLDSAGNETVLHSFTGLDGIAPQAGVVRDAAGNLYGTTFTGTGAGTAGVVYKLDTAGQETVLYTFTGGADGKEPSFGRLFQDSSGNLYGTTLFGGTGYVGVVYKLDTAGQETVPYNFPSWTDGSRPTAGVIRDSAGVLYGTTEYGGAANAGTVFKVTASGHETVLYSFTGGADGGNPQAGVIRDSTGNLYGTTYYGGLGQGVVYKLDTAGHETVLHTFGRASDGAFPYAGVIQDSAGSFYGTTYIGGASGKGAVFELRASGQETVVYSFTGGADGGYPEAGVVLDSAGNLYGTTTSGGAAGAGVVYKVDTSGQETALYSFTGGADGGNPEAGVVRDSVGNLYGTTPYGGAGSGVVYEVSSAGQNTVLHTFGYADGASPGAAGVIRDSAGNLYGTTPYGGAAGPGVVYQIDAAGQETVLYNFTGGDRGGNPYAGVVLDPAGNLFGTASSGGKGSSGVVFKVLP